MKKLFTTLMKHDWLILGMFGAYTSIAGIMLLSFADLLPQESSIKLVIRTAIAVVVCSIFATIIAAGIIKEIKNAKSRKRLKSEAKCSIWNIENQVKH